MISFIWAIVIGLAAGFIAGKIMKGRGLGMLKNLIVGIIGGVVGNVIFFLLGLHTNGIIGNLVMSTVGAVILLWLIAYFRKK